MINKIGIFLCALLFAIVAGCASFEQNINTERTLVMAATMKIIEADGRDKFTPRAQQVKEFVSEARDFISLEKFTITGLKVELEKRLYETDWKLSDKILAQQLIYSIIYKLENRYVDGIKLPVPANEAIYQINTVLDWVETSAGFYD